MLPCPRSAVINRLGGSSHFTRTDVSSYDSFRDAFTQALDLSTNSTRQPRLDYLINNAGITHLPAPMEEVSEDDFDRVFAVNCKSVYLTARALVPHFKAANAGCILNIASTAGVI